MDPLSIYRKSAKGAQAISARLHGLVGRSRSLLILVDGKRGLGELLALAAGFGDVAQMLTELERDGFIEPVPGAVAVPSPAQRQTASPVVAASAPVAAGNLTLAQARAFACHKLIEVLGPTADALCLKVESTRDRDDFIVAVQRAYAVVREVRGQAEAERFGAAIEANLPSA